MNNTLSLLDIESTRRDLESLACTVAPIDLDGKPFYVTFRADMTADHVPDPATVSMIGCYAKNLDLALKSAIGIRWSGRGLAVFLDDACLMDCAAKLTPEWAVPGAIKILFRYLCTSTVLHELAHAIEDPGDPAQEIPERFEEIEALKLAAIFSADLADNKQTPKNQAVNLAGHNDRWIRAALHLEHRARAADLWPLWLTVWGIRPADATDYGLSDVWTYEAALGDEPERLAHLAIEEILSTSPPAEFAALFARDLAQRKDRVT